MEAIYSIENTVTGDIYIGSAVDYARRFRVHKSILKYNKHHSKYLQNAWNKYGAQNFKFSILEVQIPKEELELREQFWIDSLRPAYNMCPIAGNQSGRPVSEETKAKIKARTKANWADPEMRKRFMENKDYSWARNPELIEKRRRIMTGRKLSEETKKKIAAKNLGRKASPELRAVLSKAQSGKPKLSRRKAIICIDTHNGSEKSYMGIGVCANELGLDRITVGNCVKGKVKLVGKRYKFRLQ